MKLLFDLALRGVAAALICALLAPPPVFAAPKPVNPETIHRKIVTKGIGGWVCIEEANGILLVGRITSVQEQEFGMQLENYPQVTMIKYADVVRLRTIGLGGKGVAILMGVTVGAAVVTGVLMHNAYENSKPTLPAQPPSPVFP